MLAVPNQDFVFCWQDPLMLTTKCVCKATHDCRESDKMASDKVWWAAQLQKHFVIITQQDPHKAKMLLAGGRQSVNASHEVKFMRSAVAPSANGPHSPAKLLAVPLPRQNSQICQSIPGVWLKPKDRSTDTSQEVHKVCREHFSIKQASNMPQEQCRWSVSGQSQ